MTAGKRFKRLVRDRARRTGESYVSARRALLRKRTEDAMTTPETSADDDLVEVSIVGVDQQDPSRSFVELKETDGERRLPVFIGPPEAAAIASALQERVTLRPMTHDALKQALDALGGRVARIVVGYLPERSTFTADVVVALPDATERHLDWRVSDAVAVAVRCDPPPTILVPAALLAEPGSLGAAGYRLPCPSCRAPFHVAESELRPVDGAPDLAVAEVTCPACNTHHILQLRPPFGPAPGQ
jgi:predicted Zn finger-like uncharacterized protein